jgi:hypothetical protein
VLVAGNIVPPPASAIVATPVENPGATAGAAAGAPGSESILVAKLTKVFRFVSDPPAARSIALQHTVPWNWKGPSDMLALLPPIDRYGGQLSSIISPRGGLASLRPNILRYFVLNTATSQAAAEINIREATDPGSFKLNSFADDGRNIEPLMEGLVDLANRLEVQAGLYEPRDLVLTALPNASVEVLWLKSNSSAPDLIYIPLGIDGAEFRLYGLHSKTVYTADEFVNALRNNPRMPPSVRRPPAP